MPCYEMLKYKISIPVQTQCPLFQIILYLPLINIWSFITALEVSWIRRLVKKNEAEWLSLASVDLKTIDTLFEFWNCMALAENE